MGAAAGSAVGRCDPILAHPNRSQHRSEPVGVERSLLKVEIEA